MTRNLSIATLLALALSIALAGCGIGDAQQRLRTAVDAKQAELDQCYTSALSRDESIQGEVDATIRVGKADGRIESVDYEGGQVTDAQLQSCMSGVLESVQLEEAPKANLEVGYTFRMTPTN